MLDSILDSTGRPYSDEDTRKILLGWKTERPDTVGLYLYRDFREWPHRLVPVKYGAWELGQNPEWLYCGSKPIKNFEDGWWFGPILQSPERNW
jgi:hypothetical protein